MDYMRMIQDTVEYEKMVARQKRERKEYEQKKKFEKAQEELNKIKDDVVLIINVIKAIENNAKGKLKTPLCRNHVYPEYPRMIYECYAGCDTDFFGAIEYINSWCCDRVEETSELGWCVTDKKEQDLYRYSFDGENFRVRRYTWYGHELAPSYYTPPDMVIKAMYDFCNKFKEYKELFDKWFKENFTV